MAWTKFVARPKASAGTGVTASLRKGKTGPAKMNFTIRPDLAALWGWIAGDKLEVMLGDGEHHGLVRFRKNNSVGTVEVIKRAGVHHSHYFTIGLGHVASYVDRGETKRWVNAEAVEDAWVEFVLPSWADETSPNRRRPAEPAVVPQTVRDAANFVRPKRDVAPTLMGDPPAGRSALAEKQRA